MQWVESLDPSRGDLLHSGGVFMGRKTMKRCLFDLLTPNYVLFQSLAEYVLALPSSLKLGAPHPEQICIDLLRRGEKAKLKVEVFNSIGKDSHRKPEDFYRTPQEIFKIMKKTWFPDVGKEELSCLIPKRWTNLISLFDRYKFCKSLIFIWNSKGARTKCLKFSLPFVKIRTDNGVLSTTLSLKVWPQKYHFHFISLSGS